MKEKSVLSDILKREKELKIQEKEKLNSLNIIKEASEPQKTESIKNTPRIQEWEQKFNAGLIDTTNDIRFYFLQDEYLDGFKEQYKKYYSDLEKFGISSYKFLDYARESFERFKEMKKYLPLEPMNKKSFEYSTKTLDSLLEKLVSKFK